MVVGEQYYATFVLSYLRNALHKLRACQIAEQLPTQPGTVVREDAVASIVFSAMTLEAFANYCIRAFVTELERAGATRNEIEALEEDFERLSVSERFKGILKRRDPDFMVHAAADWNAYLELAKLRNLLVHASEKKTSRHFNSIEALRSDDARKALTIVNRMMSHAIRLFSDLIPGRTYSPATFEPTLTRVYPREIITLSQILEEPFQAREMGLRPFRGFGPKEYRGALNWKT